MQEQLKNYLEQGNYSESISITCIDLIGKDKYKVDKSKKINVDPVSLYVRDLLGIKEQDIDFSKPIQLINGQNGICKTLLSEIPRMLFFNDGRDVIKNLIKKDTHIVFKFKVEVQLYKLTIEKKDWILFKGEDDIIEKGQTKILDYFRKIGINITKTETREKIRGIFERCTFVKDRSSFVTNLDPKDLKLIFLELFELTVNADLIKEDVKLVIEDKEKEVLRNEGKLEVLDSDEGIHTVELNIENLKSELKNEKKLKEEFLNIVVDGTDSAAKRVDEIQVLKNEKTGKEDSIKKTEFLNKNKNIFSELKDLNDKKEKYSTDKKQYDEYESKINNIKFVKDNKNVFSEYEELKNKNIKQEKEYNEYKERKGEIESKIRMVEFDRDNIQDSLEKLKKVSGKCKTCGSELNETRKKVMLDEKNKKSDELANQVKEFTAELEKLKEPKMVDIDSDMRKSDSIIAEFEKIYINTEKDLEKYLTENDIENVKEPKLDDNIDADIITRNTIVAKLEDSDINSDEDIEKFIEKNNSESLNKDISKLNDMIKKKETDYKKFVETDKSERKKELEIKLEEIANKRVELGILEDKLKRLSTLDEDNKKVNDEIERLNNELEEYNKIKIIFNRVKDESFPVWFLNENKTMIQNQVNEDLQMFKKFNLSMVINEKFQIKTNGYNPSCLSTSEEKILNTILHYHILKEKFGKVPFVVLDDYNASIEPDTLVLFKTYINKISANINNMIITAPTDSPNIKVNYLDKI